MISSKIYYLHGRPRPLARPRFAHGVVYDSQKDQKKIDSTDIYYQNGSLKMHEGPVELIVEFIFKIPESYSKAKQAQLLGQPCINNIDLDNLIKFIADVCIGVLYTDDKIITTIQAAKIWGSKNMTQFSLRAL